MRRSIDVEPLRRTAKALGELRNSVVFIGGAAIPLLVTDEAMPYVRPTKDVDIVVEAATRAEYYALCEQLRALGFREDRSVGAPICRWVHGDQRLDVMPIDEEILGLRGRWFRAACDSAWACELEPGCAIRVAAAPEIVATKIDAFADRGGGDYALSKDMDDLVTLVDGRPELPEEIRRSTAALQAFIRDAEIGRASCRERV